MKDSLQNEITKKISSSADNKSEGIKPKAKRRLSGFIFENIDIKPSRSTVQSGSLAFANALFEDNQ